jgi:hypothetical protein
MPIDGVPVLVGGGDWLTVEPAALQIGPLTLQSEVRLPVSGWLDNRLLDSPRSFQRGVVWAFF